METFLEAVQASTWLEQSENLFWFNLLRIKNALIKNRLWNWTCIRQPIR